jgi:hypothetical protein
MITERFGVGLLVIGIRESRQPCRWDADLKAAGKDAGAPSL